MSKQSIFKNQTSPSSTKKTNSKPAPVITNDSDIFYCTRCNKHYKQQKGNFMQTQSSLFRSNGGFLPVCKTCTDELFVHYTKTLGNEHDAVKRMCIKFDYYWSENIYNTALSSRNTSTFRSYVNRTNQVTYIGKTYDDTLDEDNSRSNITSGDGETISKDEELPSEDVIEYWGFGLPAEQYIALEYRRKYWMKQYPPEYVLDYGEEALLRQVCACEIDINRERALGHSVEKMQNTLNSLLGGMNIKPSQKKEFEDNYMPFGVEIAKWEDEKPVIDPDPEFQDVDGFKRNIVAWFLGQLCRMVGIKNKYSDIYEEELRKYSVEKPKFEDDDDESTFDDIFGKSLEKPGGDSNG